MQDKIALLMEETGCDRGEAELALEMSGFQVQEAVKAIARLLRNIVVLKGKFVREGDDQFGLFQLVGNLRTGGLLRARAVLSFNPAVFNAGMDRGWFEFEKYLYGCRLWEGSLQAESLEIEQALAQKFRQPSAAERLGKADEGELGKEVSAVLAEVFGAPVRRLQLKREILDLKQFQSLNPDQDRIAKARAASRRPNDELLVLKVTLEESAEGIPAEDLRAGDLVAAAVVDKRDIAQYLSKLFGGYSAQGPLPILVPVEALESSQNGLLARVRFSVGVCGDAVVARQSKVRVVRAASVEAGAEPTSWWKRIFKAG